jgi:hypothetical protein
MPTALDIKLVHTLKHAIGLDESEYRAVLYSFGVESSKQLSHELALSLISKLEAIGITKGVWKKSQKKLRWDDFAGRPDMATPAQLRMLEGLWVSVSRQPTLKEKQESFHRFLQNRFGISRVEWIESVQVGKIRKTIMAMVKQKEMENEKIKENFA